MADPKEPKTLDDVWKSLEKVADEEDVILTAGDVRALILQIRKTDERTRAPLAG